MLLFHFTRFLLLLMAATVSLPSWANDAPSPEMPAQQYRLLVENPARDVGYTVGDKLSRHIVLEVKAPYQLIPTTLPIVGYERRYQGQVIGIELRQIQHQEQKLDGVRRYTLDLQYQVFDNEATAKMFFLPAEVLKFQGKNPQDVVQIEIPSWGFRVSPLAIFGAVKIEQDMSGFRPPFEIPLQVEKNKLWASLGLLAINVLGLIYILGSRAWLPNMGKPFARAYRQLRKPEAQQLPSAITLLHQAFNSSSQTSLFSDNLALLYQRAPAFQCIDSQIQQFFSLSSQVLYENQLAKLDQAQTLAWLNQFCLQCRACERGLKPV